MLKPATICVVVLAVLFLAVWGLRSDLAACTGTSEASAKARASTAIQPLADLEGEVAGEPSVGASTLGSEADDIDPFGIVAPVFPGFGLDSYSTKCDPFDDPYGSCL